LFHSLDSLDHGSIPTRSDLSLSLSLSLGWVLSASLQSMTSSFFFFLQAIIPVLIFSFCDVSNFTEWAYIHMVIRPGQAVLVLVFFSVFAVFERVEKRPANVCSEDKDMSESSEMQSLQAPLLSC
jgi:hypothetical protein